MNETPDLAHDVGRAVVKSAPPVVVWLSGLGLNDVLAMVSIVYVLAQLGYLLWRWQRQAKSRRVADDA